MKRFFSLLLIAYLLTGCSTGREYRNISDKPIYLKFIGGIYHTRKEMQLALFKGLDPTRGNYYGLIPLPGAGGPEVIESKLVNIGTRLEILDVLECTNCDTRGSESLKEIIVAMDEFPETSNYKVYTPAYKQLVEKPDGQFGLNPEYFTRVQ